ncbi:MAG TPA: glycosyltransferase, partial [Bacteroidia bacterium]|nr:glycosyltransferase [Bacteroidia bacterium]
DMNCGLKAYKQAVVKNIEVYGEMHRYIPVIAKWAGFIKIEEKVVQHRERKYGVTKFGLERFLNGFLDLLSITFVSKFGKKPMHFFGLWGTIAFLFGGGVSFYLVLQKFRKSIMNIPTRDVTDKPLFYIALAIMIIGTQLFLAGYLGELISRSSNNRNNYQVSKRL